MKNILLYTWISILVICFASLNWAYAQQDTQPDTVLINFGTDNSSLQIVIQSDKDAEMLQQIDLNKLIRDISRQLSEKKENRDIEIQDKEDSKKENKYIDSFNGIFSFQYTGDGEAIRISKETHYYDSAKGKYVQIIRKRTPRTRHGLSLDIGFNNYLRNSGSVGDTPYELRIGGSRYVAVESAFKTQIGGQNSPFIVQYGVSISWYNFMFNGRQRAVQGEQSIEFVDANQPLTKSKLTVPYLNIPIRLHLDFGSVKQLAPKLALGAYAGYRIGGYSKIVYNDANNNRVREKEHNNFFLNDWRYGVSAEFGLGYNRFTNGFKVFCNYDMNPLFADNGGPQLNAISFGIRL
ncbi:MAG: outer membrane beta-barrel protein [Bernardetiaceae bacterium]|nr:outer membrane beta-barrel protein [Bernardetiaceae bacterium]